VTPKPVVSPARHRPHVLIVANHGAGILVRLLAPMCPILTCIYLNEELASPRTS